MPASGASEVRQRVQHDGRDFKIVSRCLAAVACCRPLDLGRGESSPSEATSLWNGPDNLVYFQSLREISILAVRLLKP